MTNREEAINVLKTWIERDKKMNDADRLENIEIYNIAIEALESQPCEDTVSIGVFEQVKWERDVAVEQLEQLGYSLGEKIRTGEDCISRAYIESIVEELENICINADEHILSLLSSIKNAPSVTPQPKTGHWIADVDKWGDVVTTVNGYKCSECESFNADKDKYCPNCGAKMEAKADDENFIS